MQLKTEFLDGIGTVHVQGEVDTLEAPKLHEVADEMLSDGAHGLVIDCGSVDFIDSAGLSVLVALQQRAQAQGGTVTVRRPSAVMYRLLQITGLDGPLRVEEPPAPEA
jgi:anti-sigma B factor antagonist